MRTQVWAVRIRGVLAAQTDCILGGCSLICSKDPSAMCPKEPPLLSHTLEARPGPDTCAPTVVKESANLVRPAEAGCSLLHKGPKDVFLKSALVFSFSCHSFPSFLPPLGLSSRSLK